MAHEFAGSLPARLKVNLPGHCDDCAERGHLAVHPGLQCWEVGCSSYHGPDLQKELKVGATVSLTVSGKISYISQNSIGHSLTIRGEGRSAFHYIDWKEFDGVLRLTRKVCTFFREPCPACTTRYAVDVWRDLDVTTEKGKLKGAERWRFRCRMCGAVGRAPAVCTDEGCGITGAHQAKEGCPRFVEAHVEDRVGSGHEAA